MFFAWAATNRSEKRASSVRSPLSQENSSTVAAMKATSTITRGLAGTGDTGAVYGMPAVITTG